MFPSWRWALDVANAAPLCPALLVFWPMGRCLHPVETGSLNSDLHSLNLDTPIISSLILSIYKNLWFHRAYFLTHHWVHEGSMGHFKGVNWMGNPHGDLTNMGDILVLGDEPPIVWPWKSPISSGNKSSKPDDCQGRTVNLLEGKMINIDNGQSFVKESTNTHEISREIKVWRDQSNPHLHWT